MAPKIRIRDIQASDRVAWEELWTAYLEFYKQYLPPEVTEFTWSRLLDSSEPLSGFVAVDNAERLVGFVHHHIHLSTWSLQGYCYLEDLYVDKAARGLGAGRALIETVYEWADERGATRVYWHTDVANVPARRLYDRVGMFVPYVQYRRR
jgi:GNAT superfamily N-acetyltransferase